jgi:hypothetical protein
MTGAVKVLLVSACALPRLTSVSVAAGTVAVNAEAAEAGVSVMLPVAVEDARVSVPLLVPAIPRVGVAVQPAAVVLVLLGTCPAAAEVAFVPPCATVTAAPVVSGVIHVHADTLLPGAAHESD